MARTFLFTAFEPSGDAHAAPVIAALRAREPGTRVIAFGGPRMAEAGAELVEETTSDPAMLGHALGQAWGHWKRLRRLEARLRRDPPELLVPVDSPAANFPACARFRRRVPNGRIAHLVAPQLWAWGAWRVRKLRRRTDRVLCLLPFEADWFAARGVPARFVGHPLFSPAPARREADPGGPPRLALLPGSRAAEVRANWPTMVAAAERARRRYPDLELVAALRDEGARALIAECGDRPAGLAIETDPRAAFATAHAALVASGTASLEAVAHGAPTVVLYNVSRWQWQLIGRWLIRTRYFALPNVIAHGAGEAPPVPELIPHFGDPDPVAEAVERLLGDPEARAEQRARGRRIADLFEGTDYPTAAARAIHDLASGVSR